MNLRVMALVLTVDRIEGDFAVVEAPSGLLDVPLYLLPPGVGEGDQVRLRTRTLATSTIRLSERFRPHGAAGFRGRSQDAGGLAPALEHR